MRYLISKIVESPQGNEFKNFNEEMASIERNAWRRCPSEESAVAAIRAEYPDAMPGPYELQGFGGRKLPAVLVWKTARDMGTDQLPVFTVLPVPENRDDERQLKDYARGKKKGVPFSQEIWTKGVVPEPAIVGVERQGLGRFIGFIGEVAATVRTGQDKQGRHGLWFHVEGYGPFSVVLPEGAVLFDEHATKYDKPEGAPDAPFHKIFGADITPNRALSYATSEDLEAILGRAEFDAKQYAGGFAEYMGELPDGARGSELMRWYGNGPPPAPREGMIAMLHPQIHKRAWTPILDAAAKVALYTDRVIWIVECEGSHWYMLMVGDRHEVEGAWDRHVRTRDQFIGTMDADRGIHVLGTS